MIATSRKRPVSALDSEKRRGRTFGIGSWRVQKFFTRGGPEIPTDTNTEIRRKPGQLMVWRLLQPLHWGMASPMAPGVGALDASAGGGSYAREVAAMHIPSTNRNSPSKRPCRFKLFNSFAGLRHERMVHRVRVPKPTLDAKLIGRLGFTKPH